jgi:hypothetical protein
LDQVYQQDPHTILNFLFVLQAEAPAVQPVVQDQVQVAAAVGERLRRPKLVLVKQLQLLLVLQVLEVQLAMKELMVAILKWKEPL